MADAETQYETQINTLSMPSYKLAAADFSLGIKDYKRWSRMAMFMIKRTYWRTSLGLVWPMLSFVLFVTMLSLLWGILFEKDLRIYMPHFGYGFTCWIFLNSMVSGGDSVFNSNAGVIREFPLPLSFYAFMKTYREMFIFGINLTCMIAIDIVYIHALSWTALMAIPGILIYIIDGVLVAMIMGMLSTRFRDVSQIVPNLMRAFFFFTPVLWTVEARLKLWPVIVSNPFYHAIEVIRAPMSGNMPTLLNWGVMLSITVVLLLIVLAFFKAGTRSLRVWL